MTDAGSFKKGIILLVFVVLAASGCAGGQASLKRNNYATLEKVDVADNENSASVILTVDRPVTFTTIKLTDPPRLVVDLAGVDLGDVKNKIDVKKGPITSITPSKAPDARRVARLEISLDREAAIKTAQNGPVITIIFDKKTPQPKEEAQVNKEAPAAPAEAIKQADTAASAAVSGRKLTSDEAKKETPKHAVAVITPITPPAAAQRKAGPDAKFVNNITFKKIADGGCVVKIEGDGNFKNPSVFKVGGDRLVVDLPGTSSIRPAETIEVNGKLLKKVRMAGHKESGKVRVVLDVSGPYEYDVTQEFKAISIMLMPSGKLAAKKAVPAAPNAAASSSVSAPAKPVAAAVPAALAPVKPMAAAIPVAATSNLAAATTVAAMSNTAAATPVAATNSIAAADPPQAAPAAEVNTIPNGTQGECTNPDASAAKPSSAAAPATPVNIYVTHTDGKAVLSSKPLTQAGDGAVQTEGRIYTGGRISFDIQDAELDKVIKLLADVAGLNLIMDPSEVKGKVTLKLDNVPWDQALDILLKIYNLDRVIDGNVMRVTLKSRLDDEKRRDLLEAAEQKKLEQQAQDLYTRTFKINYSTVAEIEPNIKKILSPRGEETMNPRTNELVVTDVRDKLDKVERLINILDKEVHQIMIEAKIITVDVSYSRSIGVTWGMTKNTSHNPYIAAGGGAAANTISTGGNADVTTQNSSLTASNPPFLLNVPTELAATAAGGGFGSLIFGHLLKGVNLDLTVQALESVNKAETLSAPKVVTLENKAATITSGTTIYVQTTSAAGTAPTALNANLSLAVTPRVIGDDLISMDVVATDNSPSNNVPPGATAAIDTQAVTTNVLVKDGDTIVLGGIYIKGNNKNESRVPILGSIPLLGWLFKNQTYDEPQTELLIFITPKLLKPTI